MKTATISSKGQLVIPKDIRKRAGVEAGDVMKVTYEDGFIKLGKASTLDELSEHFTALIKPGTPPLKDTSTLYSEREARL